MNASGSLSFTVEQNTDMQGRLQACVLPHSKQPVVLAARPQVVYPRYSRKPLVCAGFTTQVSRNACARTQSEQHGSPMLNQLLILTRRERAALRHRKAS